MRACMELAFALKQPAYLRMGKADRGDAHLEPVSLQVSQWYACA